MEASLPISSRNKHRRLFSLPVLGVSLMIFLVGLLLGLPVLVLAAYVFFFIAVVRVAFIQDQPFMIRWLLITVALLQWIVVPSLSFFEGSVYQGRASMWMPIDQYMALTVPSVFALAIGIFAAESKAERKIQKDAIAQMTGFVSRYPDLPVLLTVIAFLSSVGSVFLPPTLAFVAYLLTNLKYAAVILFLFSKSPDKLIWIGVIVGMMFIEAATTSLFHDAILWSVLIGGAYAYQKRISIPNRLLLGLLFLLVVTLINSVKADYRDRIWKQAREGSAVVYLDLTGDKFEKVYRGETSLSRLFDDLRVRLNQGRIISRIMYNVPRNVPFQRGETIKDGIVAALVPRFIMPDKARAGGQKVYQLLTGWKLNPTTSMGASILGEAYGNFGVLGAIVFMAIFGYLVSYLLRMIVLYSANNPLLLALVPCVFIHMIKAETDFVTVVNFIVKAALLYTVVFFGLTKVLHYRYRPQKALSRG